MERRSPGMLLRFLRTGSRACGTARAATAAPPTRWLACCLLVTLLSWTNTVRSAAGLSTPIGSQPLAAALVEFAHQTGLHLIYVSQLAAKRQSHETPAGLSPTDTLTLLLKGTGLNFQFLNPNTVRIFEPEAVAPASLPSATNLPMPRAEPPMHRLDALEEVIVTATRREERAGDVPISMAVWSQEAITAWGAKDTADIAALTPGVQFDHYPERPFQTNIAMRGLNGRDGTAIGMYIDDVPIPAPSAWGASIYRSFPLLFDLGRVEVLRGPQGTLFGQGAMGGAVRFITQQPNLTEYSGVTSADVAKTERGGMSYESGAAVGGPLVPGSVGFRVAGWIRSDGGFIDRVDPFTGAIVDANANRTVSEVFRAALLFAPRDTLHIESSLMYQSESVHDTSSFYTYLSDPGAGILENGKLLRQPGDDEFALASLKLTANFATADLTALSAYFHRTTSELEDSSNIGIWDNPMGPEYPLDYSDAIPIEHNLSETSFSEEVRLSSAVSNSRLSWLAGAFYSYEHHLETDNTVALDPTVGSIVDGNNSVGGSETVLAAFGQVALRIAQQYTATAGLRVAHYEHDANFEASGPANAGVPSPFVASSQNAAAVPRFGIEYRPVEEQLFYASIAEGYRPGGLNAPLSSECGVPEAGPYRADSLWSYELGGKNRLFDGHLQLNTSLFYARWRNTQLPLITPAPGECAYTTNAGSAMSRGFELQAQGLLTEYLKTDLSLAYEDARYTQTVRVGSLLIVANGDVVGTLPLVPSPWDLRGSIDYARPLGGGGITGFARAEDEIHSHNPGPFYSQHPDDAFYAPARVPDPTTNLLNARAGLRWSRVEVGLYVNNLLDSQPTLSRRNNYREDTLIYATTFRPRTIGLSGSVQF
jgi:iron complex outermembrane recepter protein